MVTLRHMFNASTVQFLVYLLRSMIPETVFRKFLARILQETGRFRSKPARGRIRNSTKESDDRKSDCRLF